MKEEDPKQYMKDLINISNDLLRFRFAVEKMQKTLNDFIEAEKRIPESGDYITPIMDGQGYKQGRVYKVWCVGDGFYSFFNDDNELDRMTIDSFYKNFVFISPSK